MLEQDMSEINNKNYRGETKNQFYYKKDRLNQLRGFCATVQCDCCAAKAAEVLSLEAGTIGQQVKALERDLNIKLFERKANKLILTKEGRKFYEMSIPALQQIDGLFSKFRKDLTEKNRNTLTVASIDAILGKIIKHTANFRKKNPEINITLLNISKEEAFEGLRKDEIDLVLYPSEKEEEYPIEFDREVIMKYNSYWTLYKGHPLLLNNKNELSKEDIVKYPFGYLPNSYMNKFKNFLKSYKITSPIDLKNGTIEFLKEMVRNKICITVLDDFYITPENKKEFELINSNAAFPELFHYRYYKKNFPIKNLTLKFLELIEKNKNEIFI